MTIINNIEIDNIHYNANGINGAIRNNDPIEEKLHVIIAISNPVQYARRFILAREFVARFEHEEPDCILYIVELAYGNQKHRVAEPNHPRHLQLRTNTSAWWAKEGLQRVGVNKLLPEDWKAVAFIDADIEFSDPNWAINTLKILNGYKDVVQPFSHCVDMDQNQDAMSIFPSAGYQFENNRKYKKKLTSINQFHPGYGLCFTRKAYEKLGGVYHFSILGSGDRNQVFSFLQKAEHSINSSVHPNYIKSLLEYQKRAKGLRFSYVPGVIRHHFHGHKKERFYGERWKILSNYQYDPELHTIEDKNGLIVPSKHCPKAMLEEILQYFKDRNEDVFLTGSLLSCGLED